MHSIFKMTKAWNLKQCFIDHAWQNLGSRNISSSGSFANGSRILLNVHQQRYILVPISATELTISLVWVGLVIHVDSDVQRPLAYVMSPLPPDPLVAQKGTQLDLSVVAEVRRN